ncbi:hypothetical protein [Nocardia stercoris]|uniref:DUF4267 domain-containing protein n=1 Tax=Nocardia stercoris TaxID=2483361 RepID=A0A3M2KZM4_9NOCA|nr:hypothetical protein [Nocardia stercoris]RMI28995.1 hypothetical protein EBN03_28090 [Nocardia stercoris]
MKTRLLLRGSALYLGAAGALALLAPRSAVSGLKSDPAAFDIFTTRTVGATLVALAITNWSATPGRGILLANLVLNAVLGVVDVTAIAEGTIGNDAWQGAAVHGGLIAAFGSALRAQPPAFPSRVQRAPRLNLAAGGANAGSPQQYPAA